MRPAVLMSLATLMVATPARAQAPTMLTAAQLQEDVRVLRDALETLHPGLYRYQTPAQSAARFDALARELDRPMTLAQAYLAIARVLDPIQCGHTFPNPVNQAAAVKREIVYAHGRVPFYFRWLDGRMIVTRNVSADPTLVPGTEVRAINGHPALEILGALRPYARADGGNDAKRIANFEVVEAPRVTMFDVYFPLLFPPPAGDWVFELATPGGARRTVRLAPVSATSRDSITTLFRAAQRDSTRPPWTTHEPAPGMMVMTMPSWVTFNDNWKWEEWIHEAFRTMAARRTQDLVIDLRGNEGGTGVGDVILSHLVRDDLVITQFQRYVKYLQAPERLRPYLDTWDRTFDDWTRYSTPAADHPGFHRMRRWDDGAIGTIIKPVAPRFEGRVWVLVGAENSSATFEFALTMRDNKLGTLVGQPTGGNQRGINGSAFYFLRLPNSKIEIDLPLVAQFADGPRPDAGIAPDIVVRQTQADIAAGRDAALERIMTMNKDRQSRRTPN